MIALYILLLIFIFLNGGITIIPLPLLLLLCVTVIKRSESIFVLAFLTGCIIDILTLRILGQTAVFYLLFLFLVILYERKYEVNSLPFIIVTSFLGAIIYSFFFNTGNWFLMGFISAGITIFLFLLIRLLYASWFVTGNELFVKR